MIRCKCISVILLLASWAVPVWAGATPTAAAIELNNNTSPHTVTGSSVTVGEQPTPIVAARVSVEPEQKSWLDRVAEMTGLGTSDPGTSVTPSASHLAVPLPDYIVGPGDVIGISVWKDDSLTRTVVVLPDGKITFPLLGDLVAGGKTVAQLKQILEAGLARYVADSSVTVEVKQSNSMIIYIIGRVNAPGRQVLVANTNVLQALAMAGGPNPFARKSKVKIFRQEGGKTSMFLFDYDEVADGRHLEMNIELKRGDVVLVP